MSSKDTADENVSCSDCGRTFDSTRAKKIHQTRGCDSLYADPDALHEAYHEEDLSAKEIASRCGVTPTTIYNYLRDHGIPLKDKKTDPTRPPSHRLKERPSRNVGTCSEIVSTTIAGSIYSVRIHRLVAVATGDLAPGDFWDRDKIVHHKSQHGWDNRHANLEVMDKSDHRAAHSRLD